MEGSPSAVSIAGGVAALGAPTASLDAARQITTLELLQCGGESGNERYDVTAIVPFPLTIIPRFGFGSAQGRYLRGAIVSHALLCLLMLVFCCLVGVIRSQMFIARQERIVKRAGGSLRASPFLE